MKGRRHKFTAQAKSSKVADGVGGFTTSWNDSFNFYGRLETITLDQTLIAAQGKKEITHTIDTFYDSRLTKNNRIKYGSRIFNVITLENISERNLKQRLLVKEEA
jgi:SPP1 family predicted phage head-tail adaptor